MAHSSSKRVRLQNFASAQRLGSCLDMPLFIFEIYQIATAQSSMTQMAMIYAPFKNSVERVIVALAWGDRRFRHLTE